MSQARKWVGREELSATWPGVRHTWKLSTACVLALVAMGACGGDDGAGGGTAAQRRGVGAACAADAECVEPGQRCLPFKGGYCGIEGCTASAECPDGSACVAHDDGKDYCFLVCTGKPECNVYRPIDDEANCSSSVKFVDTMTDKKACVPPS